MIERQVDIPTSAGAVGTFVCHPERNGPHPVILFFMDAPGIREELSDMARRLASVGYYVLLPNLYYRSGVGELGPFIGPSGAAVRDTFMALMAGLTIEMIMADADALLTFADADAGASKGPVGTLGYCMSGRYAISAAVRHPNRVAAAASIYGTQLVTDKPSSPHRTALQAKAAIYVACAEHDIYMPIDQVAPLRDALRDGDADAEVELYPGVHHGFAFPQRPAYDRAAAERHWERLFALFARRLVAPVGQC